MFKCLDCDKTFEEPKTWKESHGFTDGQGETFSGCPHCNGDYLEIQPCVICGQYPENEYDCDGELENGLCKECFENGVKNHFMEYLHTLDSDNIYDFYCGNVDCQSINVGYAYLKNEILEVLISDYDKYINSDNFNVNIAYPTWCKFIGDNDTDHFGEWLIDKMKKES